MFKRCFDYLSTSFGDFVFALSYGVKGSIKPRVLMRSALISVAAMGFTSWLFFFHWGQAIRLAGIFTPTFLPDLSKAGQPWVNSASKFAAINGAYDYIGTARHVAASAHDFAQGISHAFHAVIALAIAVLCSFIFCYMAAITIGIRFGLLERARKYMPKSLSLQVAGATTHSFRSILRVVWVAGWYFVVCQIVFQFAIFVPHVGVVWLLLIAHFFPRLIAFVVLRAQTSVENTKAILKRLRISLLLMGLFAITVMWVPVLNLWVPGLLCSGILCLCMRALKQFHASACSDLFQNLQEEAPEPGVSQRFPAASQ